MSDNNNLLLGILGVASSVLSKGDTRTQAAINTLLGIPQPSITTPGINPSGVTYNPITGQPIYPTTGQPTVTYNPITGQPIYSQPTQPRFDPYTGQPIYTQPQYDPLTGQPVVPTAQSALSGLNLGAIDLKTIATAGLVLWGAKQTFPGWFKLPGSSKEKTETLDPNAERDSVILTFQNGAPGVQQAVQQLMDIGGKGKIVTFGRDGTEMVWTIENQKLVNGNLQANAQEFAQALATSVTQVPSTLMLRSADKQMQDKFSTFAQASNTLILQKNETTDPAQNTGPKTDNTLNGNGGAPAPGVGPLLGYMTNFVPATSIGFNQLDKLQAYINGDVAILKNVNFVTKDAATGNAMIWEPVKGQGQPVQGQGMRTKINGVEITLTPENFALMWQNLAVPGHNIAIKNELAVFSQDQTALNVAVNAINMNINSRNQAEGLKNPTLSVSEFRGAAPKVPAGPATGGGDVKTTSPAGGTAPAGTAPASDKEKAINALVDRFHHLAADRWSGKSQTSNAAWDELKKDPLLKTLPGAINELLTGHVEKYKGTGKLGRYLDAKGVGTNDEKYKDNPNSINPFNNNELKNLLKAEFSKEGVDLNKISAQLDGICKVTSYSGTADMNSAANRGDKISMATAQNMVNAAYGGKALPAAPVETAPAPALGGAKPAVAPELVLAGGG